jgi:CHAT domain-containing protein/Tfp pilus assembly protein PilF
VLAVGLGVTAARPVEGAPPPEKARAEAVAEATRLMAEVERLYGQGKYDDALALAQRALGIREKALGPDHLDVAQSLNDLAVLYDQKADYPRAEALYVRALGIREKALGPDHVDVAESLHNLALLCSKAGDYARAESLYVRSLAIYEKALGPDHPGVALALNGLAQVYQFEGDYPRAESLYQRALAIREKALGPDHLSVAISVNNLAEVYRARGDDVRVEPLYLRALGIFEKALGPEHVNVAGVVNNLAQLYQAKGDYARAEPLFLRALAIREKVLGPDHPEVALSLVNLAELYYVSGPERLARAEPLFQRALAIQEKALGPGHTDVALSLNNLAAFYQQRGDYARAEPLFQRALAIREKALGPAHADVALALDNLAGLYRAEGDLDRADPLQRRALDVYERALGPDHPYVAISLENLARLRVLQGRLPEAVSAAQRAADIQDRRAATLLATGSEEQKRLYMRTLADATDRTISLHVQQAPADPGAARVALTVLLRRKGRVLDAMSDSLAALRRSLAPVDREILDRLAAVYARLSAQASRGPGRAPPEQYRRGLVALEEERQALEIDVGRRSAAFRSDQRLVALSDVQAKIPRGAALVEIARYAPRDLHEDRAFRKRPPRYVAYVLRPDGDPTFTDLGEAAPLEAAVDAFRRALGDPDQTHDPKPAARALDRLLMSPVRALLGETRWVFTSPDAALNLVPFGALADERGHYLVERYLFSYLTSGRDLLRFGEERPPSREPPLILAAPAFDAASAPRGPESAHRGTRSLDMVTHALLPLEGTAEEARTIARLFPDSRVLLGAQATEEAVKAAHAPRLLHFATHGFFLPPQPVPELLLRSPGAALAPDERAALLQRESPLVRSGVALAGFNKRGDGSDAGVLTALDAAGLDLYGTRLVVLSTCDSGLGEPSAGEGVYGMRRALTMAGAETQVMSLWQVDTGRTRELMEAYYRQLKDGAGRSEAMRAVQLAMLATPATASPNLWASFLVSGEWRSLEGGSKLPAVAPVEPGLRGCSCRQAGATAGGRGGLLFAALTLLARRRRRGPKRFGGPSEGPPS